MTVEVDSGATTVEQDVPRGVFKRRRLRSSPPVVIEVKIDLNRPDEPAKQQPPATPRVAEAIEAVAVGKVNSEARGWPAFIGMVGDAVGSRIDEILSSATNLVAERIDEIVAGANSRIDELVEETVTQAMDTVIHNVIEARLSQMLGGVTIDLTKLENEAVSVTEAAGETTDPVID